MEDESVILEIRAIYDDYIADVKKLIASRKPTDGLMGFGKRAGDDICHERFADRLEQKFIDIAQASPSSEEAFTVMRYVFETPPEYKNDSLTYLMLLAVQGLTDVLIPFLSKEDACKLSSLFSDLYPKYSYLPAQKKLAEQLISQSGQRGQKIKGLLGLFGSREDGKG
ncbi:MAG: hypothetical protein QMB62_02475 [Oscillospiraceae bacterium]